MRHYAVFNPHAGSFSWQEMEQIRETLESAPGMESRIILTDSVSFLENLLYEHRDFHPDLFGIGGGDGTASETLTAVAKIWGSLPPLFVPYSCGTVNNWSYAFGLSDGLVDKVKKASGLGTTKALAVAEYLRDCAGEKREPRSEPLALLDINGKKGFNVGFMMVPKLLWTYYGKSIAQYQGLEEALKTAPPEKYLWELQKIWSEQNLLSSFVEFVSQGNEALLKRTGAAYALATALLSVSSAFNPFSPRAAFYQEPFDGEIYLDGKLHHPPRPVNAVYISTYPHFNLGLKALTFLPTPDAGKFPGRMEVVLCSESTLGLALQLPLLRRGDPLAGLHYFFPREIILRSEKPLIGQVEGDFIIADEFTVRYDRDIKVVSPYRNLPQSAAV